MNNMIQEIMVKVKSEIENKIIKTLEGEINLDRMVNSVGEMVNNIGLDTLSAIVGEINKHIKDMLERKGKYYLQRKNDNRSLVTRFGLFELERDYYRQEREKVNKEEKIKKLDQRVIKGRRSKYAAIEPGIMTDMPLLSRKEGRWLKDMLNFLAI